MHVERSRGSWYDIAAIGLGLLALGISIYLTIVHYQESLLVCTVGGCETVQASKYATIGPVPIALLGLGSSLLMLGLAIARLFRQDWVLPATVAIFGLALTGFLYELYLTYIEIWVIDAICQWCVAFAVVTLIWLIVELVRLWREELAIDDGDYRT